METFEKDNMTNQFDSCLSMWSNPTINWGGGKTGFSFFRALMTSFVVLKVPEKALNFVLTKFVNSLLMYHA